MSKMEGGLGACGREGGLTAREAQPREPAQPRDGAALFPACEQRPQRVSGNDLILSSLTIKCSIGTSPVAQWLRIRLPMQGTRVRAPVREDPTCHGATKPVRHNYWACALEPTSHNCWARVPQLLSLRSRAREPQLLSPRAATTEAHAPRARAPQQEKPPQWEARAPQQRVALARRNWRKPACSNEDPMQPKINK